MKTLHLVIIVLIGATMYILLQFPLATSESGFYTGTESPPSSDLSNMSLVLHDKFQQTSTNSTDLYLEFFDEKNKTLIKNVSFFVNATKDDNVLIHELFFTHTGVMTLKFSPGTDMGKWVVNGTVEPVLGGMMSDNDILSIEMPAFTPGTYHIHIEALALVHTNSIIDQTNPPTFDSWWSVDDKGNISKYSNSTTVSISTKIKNTSPLKQFRSGVAAKDVKCKRDLSLVFKLEDGTPACVKPDTGTQLLKRGWGTDLEVIKVKNANASVAYGMDNGSILSVTAYGLSSTSSSGGIGGASILIVSIDTTSNGTLIVTMPRILIDAKSDNHDDNFTILSDGQEIKYAETSKTMTSRTLSIPYQWGVKHIEIIGYGYYNKQPPPTE